MSNTTQTGTTTLAVILRNDKGEEIVRSWADSETDAAASVERIAKAAGSFQAGDCIQIRPVDGKGNAL